MLRDTPLPIADSVLWTTMDALKAEIASKRKAIQDDPLVSARPTKYMRRGDIEKLKEEQELKEREQKQKEIERKEAATIKAATIKVCILSPFVSMGKCQAERGMEDRSLQDQHQARPYHPSLLHLPVT